MQNKNQNGIISAIIVAGFLIAGAILLRGAKPTLNTTNPSDVIPVVTTTLTPVNDADRTIGNKKAKVTIIMYEDFQCPYCGAISGLLAENSPVIQSLKQRDPNWTPFMPEIMDNYVKNGDVLFVYRDYPLSFLGIESIRSAEAARCAGDQNKFWEYHDYLFAHQNGEGQGAFSDPNLKSFAKILNLNTTTFDQCLDQNKYSQVVLDSRTEGSTAGVTGTPKGFIVRDGKIISTIDGAESLNSVKTKIENGLKDN